VHVGDTVTTETELGVVGNTGLVGASTQLYFEVRQNKETVNPKALLPP
jgi:murein DD-endopeptidase MepM/ murein hydrolase activator NlpD